MVTYAQEMAENNIPNGGQQYYFLEPVAWTLAGYVAIKQTYHRDMDLLFPAMDGEVVNQLKDM